MALYLRRRRNFMRHISLHMNLKMPSESELFGIYIKLFSLQRSKPYFIIPHTGRLSGLPPVTLRAGEGPGFGRLASKGPSA